MENNEIIKDEILEIKGASEDEIVNPQVIEHHRESSHSHSHSRSHSHTHSHSHHSHHKHHRPKKRTSKTKKKAMEFIKKHRSVLVNIVACTVAAAMLVIVGVNIDAIRQKGAGQNHTEITKSTVQIETSLFTDEVSLVSEAINYYMSPTNQSNANAVYKLYGGQAALLNEGVPLDFTYSVTGLPVGVDIKELVLEVSEKEDYTNPRIYNLDPDKSSIKIYNLKTGTKYYYRVMLTLEGEGELGTVGTFTTVKSPRILKVDGAQNVRDIGGHVTLDGKTVKQGLLIRGTELDGAVEAGYKITDTGRQQMLVDLGIRFDMDLRGENENTTGVNALGKNVVHKYYGIGMYVDIFGAGNSPKIREIFSDLANPNNYPIYMHCTYGRDRTGTICYLLEALLGMSDKQLDQEYDISAFTDSFVNTALFNTFTEKVSTLNGNTTKQKVENYLLSIGVTQGEIESIRNIFLEN